MSDHRLRQGHHEPRNLWEYPADTPPESKTGHCVGQVFDPDLAAEIVAAVNAARESAQVSKVAGSGNLSGSLVAALHAELAAIHGVTPGHSLTGDYAALKGDAERLARVVEGHTNTALAHATRFVYGNGRAQITVDYEPGWGHENVPWVVRSPRPVERHPDRATALARAHALAGEKT